MKLTHKELLNKLPIIIKKSLKKNSSKDFQKHAAITFLTSTPKVRRDILDFFESNGPKKVQSSKQRLG